MKLTGIEKMENCLSGEFVYKYFFDGEWKGDALKLIAALGTMKYYGDFPRPLFEIKCSDGTILKGVESAREFRVIFPRESGEPEREIFKKRCIETAEII
jgi:hypothetical protein